MTLTDTSIDTICAISTPPGVGGIAVARVSGPAAIATVDRIWRGRPLADTPSHTVRFGTVTDIDGAPLDQAVATVFRAPRSFTGEDVVEISVHGSRFVQRELLHTLIQSGARLAGPGEFTRRAFLAGKMDLAEAEAVADVIASDSRAAHRIAISQMRGDYSRKLNDLRQRLIDLAALLELELDFSEEDVEFASRERLAALATEIHTEVVRLHRSFAAGSAIKDGIPVAIVGHTNAGKSSLLNAIVGDDRAIVSDIHGTTRDTIEETLEIGDYLFRFIDTAGLRDTDDLIEQQGIQRSLRAIDRARIAILVLDATAPIDAELIARMTTPTADDTHLIIALNKTDLVTDADIADIRSRLPADAHIATISAATGKGLDRLQELLTEIATAENGTAEEGLLVTNARHAGALAAATDSSARILTALADGLSGDLIALDLRETIDHLSAITATVTTTDILTTIFSRFCIGK